LSVSQLVRIEAKHFCAGFVYDPRPGERRQVAPILWYMRDWSLDRIETYCRKKGWKMEVFPMP